MRNELRDRLRARADGPKRDWLAALVPLAKVNAPPELAVRLLAMKKMIAMITGHRSVYPSQRGARGKGGGRPHVTTTGKLRANRALIVGTCVRLDRARPRGARSPRRASTTTQ